MEKKLSWKKSSLKKIASNRKNARRSTGPRTAAGKRKVRWNALQHGLLSREVLLPLEEGGDPPEHFAGLLDQLRRDLRPRGTLEEVLVEKIAVCYWRLRRVLRAESGEIRRERASVGVREMELCLAQTDRVAARNQETPGSGQFELRLDTSGLKILMRAIERVQREVRELGYLSPDAEHRLAWTFGKHSEGLAARCRRLSPPPPTETLGEAEASEPPEEHARPEEPAQPEDQPQPKPCPADLAPLLAVLQEEKNKLAEDLPSLKREEQREWLGRMDSFNVPSKPAADRILRYEASIQRELHRSIRELRYLRKLKSWKRRKN